MDKRLEWIRGYGSDGNDGSGENDFEYRDGASVVMVMMKVMSDGKGCDISVANKNSGHDIKENNGDNMTD